MKCVPAAVQFPEANRRRPHAVTEAFPDHPYAYNLKAALADATGKPEEALKMLQVAHEKASDDPVILSNLAGAYAKAGQKEKAIEAYLGG